MDLVSFHAQFFFTANASWPAVCCIEEPCTCRITVDLIIFFFFFKDCPALTAELRHATLLEELVFWTVKYEFPERLVCLLLKLLPDTQYKEALTRSFVRHYSRVSMMLMKSHNSDKLSNRIVHVSVQLFSNEELGKDVEIVF